MICRLCIFRGKMLGLMFDFIGKINSTSNKQNLKMY